MINNNQSKKISDNKKEPLYNKEGSLKFSDPEKQKKVMEKLEKLDPGLRDIYKGILISLENKNNPERISQTAHSIRELTALLPLYTQTTFPIEEKVARITEVFEPEKWKKFFKWFVKKDFTIPSKAIQKFINSINDVVTKKDSQRKALKSVIDSHPTRVSLPSHLMWLLLKIGWSLINGF